MFIYEIIKTIVLGIVEGITEWLPISSTGHMILVDEFLKLNETAAFKEMFTVVIQLGAILAVVTLYFKKLNPFAPSKTKIEKNYTWQMWGKVVIGCLPAAIIGLPLDDWLDEHFYNATVVAATLIIYGVAFILVELADRRPTVEKIENLTYKTALLIGAFQVLSLIPGTSRSGATILGAIILGLDRKTAAEYSFFLSIPVMFGASALKLFKYFYKGNSFSNEQVIILVIGMIVAYVVSVLAIKFLMGYIKNHDFKGFGLYRIILGVLVISYFYLPALFA